jgi:hypothetical protein
MPAESLYWMQAIPERGSGKDEPLLVHPPLRTVHVSFPTYGSSLTKALSKDPAARPAILLEGVKPWHPICPDDDDAHGPRNSRCRLDHMGLRRLGP